MKSGRETSGREMSGRGMSGRKTSWNSSERSEQAESVRRGKFSWVMLGHLAAD